MENTQPITSPDHLLMDEHYAGFIRRGVASLIDGFLVATVGRWVGTLIFSSEDLRLAGFSWTLSLIYFALLESSRHQATIGKMFMKIKVTDLDGNRISLLKAVIRHVSKILSGLILGIGYLMVIWTDKKQGLHDIIAKTLVVKK